MICTLTNAESPLERTRPAAVPGELMPIPKTGKTGCVAQTARRLARESGVVAGLHAQTCSAELQDQELTGLKPSAEAAWFADHLVRSEHCVGAAALSQASSAA